ncbi:tyrosine-protein phosphatase [Cytobacillus sp. Sa5YUA1]|uniref:Tyrosine-protein phosphatase n=1 Tax=Cytobacillus stercorigallinarum TaxID=2762240 RepID=A0ABR8QTZ9_9BACI|nr:tyrosine-protein phosphatase [Cytobacillus stercorigallinarum]MBD7938907.1 tyrosine-protein phosphatase [Cytobacillus stercorigallinarum]
MATMEWKRLEGVYNFRDIGGLVTSNGLRMKSGLLYRSDELSRLTEADMHLFRKLNIKTICDLRTVSEGESKRAKIHEEQHLSVVKIPIQDPSWELTRKGMLKFLLTGARHMNFEELMLKMYQHMAFGCQREIKQIFDLIVEKEHAPLLIHCTGGKDRTGFMSSLIQLTADVPYDRVMKEYLYSNDLIEPRMKKTAKALKIASLFRLKETDIQPVLEVREAYLEQAYKAIFSKYDTIEEYLMKECSVESEVIEKLRRRLLD